MEMVCAGQPTAALQFRHYRTRGPAGKSTLALDRWPEADTYRSAAEIQKSATSSLVWEWCLLGVNDDPCGATEVSNGGKRGRSHSATPDQIHPIDAQLFTSTTASRWPGVKVFGPGTSPSQNWTPEAHTGTPRFDGHPDKHEEYSRVGGNLAVQTWARWSRVARGESGRQIRAPSPLLLFQRLG